MRTAMSLVLIGFGLVVAWFAISKVSLILNGLTVHLIAY